MSYPFYPIKNHLIVKLTLEFALDIIEHTELLEEHRKYAIAIKQLKSGSTIGANVGET